MILVRDKDGEAAEYKGLAAIMQPLGIYCQALLHFCPDGVERELGQALHLYTDLLYTINRSHTLESLGVFHFTFHRNRIALGVYDPARWRDWDSDLQQMILIRRDPPPRRPAAKGPSTRHSQKQGETPRPLKGATIGMRAVAKASANTSTRARFVEAPTPPRSMLLGSQWPRAQEPLAATVWLRAPMQSPSSAQGGQGNRGARGDGQGQWEQE